MGRDRIEVPPHRIAWRTVWIARAPSRSAGGVTGCSIAYHLAEAGWTDVVLLEKGELTSGSTAHAAGLVTMFNPSPTMMRFRRCSIELYGKLGVFEAVRESPVRVRPRPAPGAPSGRLASGRDRAGRRAALAGGGRELMPAASPDGLEGRVGAGRRLPGPARGHLRARRRRPGHGVRIARARASRGSSSVAVARSSRSAPTGAGSRPRSW
ncbi:MAG: FAD-dependent oxidoreductase [Actinomycetota bacterium]